MVPSTIVPPEAHPRLPAVAVGSPPLPSGPGHAALGASVSGGGPGINRIFGKVRSMLLFGAMGAAAGIVFPVIPGGPVGGALIGAALSLLL